MKPLISSSRIIDGGLTFFPHPCGATSCVAALLGSTSEGGAKTTAVEDKVADNVDVNAAPTGKRGAAGFAFCAGFRRTGAKASAADHPFMHWMGILVSINGF